MRALSSLEPEPAFALLGPGFTGQGFRALTGLEERQAPGPGEEAVWLARYEETGAEVRCFVGRGEPVTPPGGQRADLRVVLDDAGFLAGVEAVRARIAAGDVYQVNLTARAEVSGVDGAALLQHLCAERPPRFAAWARLPGRGGCVELVSASPELLFGLEGRALRVEPMKGTAPADQAAWLAESEKDAAELAMITDLLRDDLHRLCLPGTVAVASPRRFITLPYAVQTVSDVVGTLPPEASVRDVFARLHPGGSVTGAPRIAACGIIRELEATPRGVYCGALAYQSGESVRCALLIRTAEKTGPARWRYGVGGGITWDSAAERELEEVHLKLGALR